jgi:hypothetical protein
MAAVPVALTAIVLLAVSGLAVGGVLRIAREKSVGDPGSNQAVPIAASSPVGTRSTQPSVRYPVRTADELLSGLAHDPLVTKGNSGWRPDYVGTPVRVRALRSTDHDIWLVPDRNAGGGVVSGVFVVDVGTDGLGNASQWAGNTWGLVVAVPPVSEAAAHELGSAAGDAVMRAELVWLRQPPASGLKRTVPSGS